MHRALADRVGIRRAGTPCDRQSAAFGRLGRGATARYRRAAASGGFDRRRQACAGERGLRDPFSETGAEAGVRPPSQPPTWRDEGRTRAGATDAGQPVPEPAPLPPEKRRNLLFSSSLRKDRDQPLVPTADLPDKVRPSAETAKPEPHPSFDDAWPKADRARRDAGALRGNRPSSAAEDVSVTTPPAPPAPDVVVVKSGVVDGMAYSLYSDGSIEAQMPEGMTRFASIDELRNHLDQRS